MNTSISFLIKPVSSACDMACRYCFYRDVISHRQAFHLSKMTESTAEHLIKQAMRYDVITFAFQGGEPTLAGLEFYQNFIHTVKQIQANQTVHYAIQTNGLRINDEWCSFLKENCFLVGVSLDGTKDNHDYLRIDIKQKGTYQRVLRSIQLLKFHQVDFNILMVLTSFMAKHPDKIFRTILQNQWKYIQFIPCLPELNQEQNQYSLTPQLFSSFYKRFFDLWYREAINGNYISITLFDNLILQFQNRPPQQCGMCGSCAFQNVIEADGSIYPCDFYALDTYRCGNINADDIKKCAQSSQAIHFLSEPNRTCHECETCPFWSLCQGNCKRLNQTYFTEEYCGYRAFLEYASNRLQILAQYFT